MSPAPIGVLALLTLSCVKAPGLEVEIVPSGPSAQGFTSFRAVISRGTEPLEELTALRPEKGPPWRLQVVSAGMTRGEVAVRVEAYRDDVLEAAGRGDGELGVPWTKVAVSLRPVERCAGYSQLHTSPASFEVARPEAGCRTLSVRAWGGSGCAGAGSLKSATFTLGVDDTVAVTVGAGGPSGGASALVIDSEPVLVAEGGAGVETQTCAKGSDGMVIMSWDP